MCMCKHALKTPLDIHLNKWREENQLDATEMLYCTHNLLNKHTSNSFKYLENKEIH